MVVLVGYATSAGSTRGVAERIADRLRQRGVTCEVRPLSDAPDLVSYDAAVLGSAIHGQHWLAPASRFVLDNAAVLRRMPVWLFSVSTVGDDESMYPPRAARRFRAMRKETAEVAGFRTAVHPREHRNFAGAVQPSDWNRFGRAFFRASGGRYGDHRNWPAVDAWADRIATSLAAAGWARTS